MTNDPNTTRPTARERTLTVGQTVLAIGVVYAALTLVSSVLALITGGETETHVHLLLRFGVTTIGVGAFYLYGVLRRLFAGLPATVTGVITYAVAMIVAMAGVWLYGLVGTLHPDAYRDLFLNFTAVAVVLTGIWLAVARFTVHGGQATGSPAPASR